MAVVLLLKISWRGGGRGRSEEGREGRHITPLGTQDYSISLSILVMTPSHMIGHMTTFIYHITTTTYHMTQLTARSREITRETIREQRLTP